MEDLVLLAWLPGWRFLKLCFLAWAVAPQTNGAVLLFDKYAVPILAPSSKQHENIAAVSASLGAPPSVLAKARAFVQRATQ
jgi:hypothetical protein